ncbi:hypothetical protein GCM10010172_84720 [Paractinoplanes ferrugineus]|uniref:RamC N-terminal domain-containing protein n=1 Tax=Paractinoplanes ferrugineus TaxID=113564 RepID=A0A919MCY0_9ACTN|nr:hypothetical protein [Actinoplanes ferrugineus]GIE15211.1 hypothetical protein Afe05nite_70510 [Actinoplanes ferrugineus]
MEHIPFTLADPDRYLPIERVTAGGTSYTVDDLPTDWRRSQFRVWTMYSPAAGLGATEGWKVHVSAAYDRAQSVLETAAAEFFALGVPFKHLSNSLFFRWQHHKQGHRPQSGKFIAAYPPDVRTARRLMDRLAVVLADERGPHILGDRRYRRSPVVAYRYGAFDDRSRVRPDGLREGQVRDGHGRYVADQRGVTFILPDGITDPFAAAPAVIRRGSALCGELAWRNARGI